MTDLSGAPATIVATDAATGEQVFLTSCDAWTADVRLAELLTDPEDFGWRVAFARRLEGLGQVRDVRLIAARADSAGLTELIAA